MNTEHTKGPWHLGMKPGPIVYGQQGEQVAIMTVAMLEQDEHIANARLIAAAPELLAALQKLLENAGDCLEVEAPSSLCDARAAIAKATGQ